MNSTARSQAGSNDRGREIALRRCGQQLTDAQQVLAAPVEVAVVEHEARHAEYAGRLRLLLDGCELLRAFALDECEEVFAVRAGPRQQLGERGGVLDVEIVSPEPLEDAVVIGAKDTVPLGVEHA